MSINSDRLTETTDVDPFDPDTYWADGELEEEGSAIDPNYLASVIQAAVANWEDAFDFRYLKPEDKKASARRVFDPKYVVPESSRAEIEQDLVGYTFNWDRAVLHHDHPVAHLYTEINELEMTEDIVYHGEVHIDLFGNLGRARKYHRRAFIMYDFRTPKDYLRYQTADSDLRAIPFSMDDLSPEGAFEPIKTITCTHALYYLHLDDIGRMLSVKGRKLRALVHRHKHSHGFLNHGEQEYWVSEQGLVTQVNVATGETYKHPTLEPLFRQSSAQTKFGGIAWTVRAAAGDSFIFEFVGCPNEKAGVYKPLSVINAESRKEYSVSPLTVKQWLGWTWVWYNTGNTTVELDDYELLSKLRRDATGCVRNERLRQDLFNKAKRLVNKLDIISIHGGGYHSVKPDMIMHYVYAAMYIDVQEELETAITHFRSNNEMVKALNAYYEKGSMPSEVLKKYIADPIVSVKNGLATVLNDPIFKTSRLNNSAYQVVRPDPFKTRGESKMVDVLDDVAYLALSATLVAPAVHWLFGEEWKPGWKTPPNVCKSSASVTGSEN